MQGWIFCFDRTLGHRETGTRKSANANRGKEYMRKITLKDNFFQVIDTEEKAYWLGFLAADGCITTGNRVVLNLSTKDEQHIHKFRQALCSQHTISFNEGHKSSYFAFRSAQMVQDLAKHGVHAQKTHTAFSPKLAPSLQPHYWRGVIDGDGCIYPSRQEIVLVGNFQLVSSFRDFCTTLYPRIRGTVRAKETIFQYSLRGKIALSILEILYAHATVFLNRKHEIYQQVVGTVGHTETEREYFL